MQPKRLFAAVIGVTIGLSTAGCGQFMYDALPLTLEELDDIRNDTSREPQEKRDALAALGLDAVTINGLLFGERLGNQFGGTLASAYAKVSENRWTALTPDEVQFYGDATDVAQYADAEALAIVAFFNDEDINTEDALEEFLEDPAKELPTGIDQVNLEEIFINTPLSTVRDKLS